MERTVEQPIIADTSALVSLATKTDQNHVPATEAAGELSEAQRLPRSAPARAGIKRPAMAPVSPVERILRSDRMAPPSPPLP
jgi:hypothetical protein